MEPTTDQPYITSIQPDRFCVPTDGEASEDVFTLLPHIYTKLIPKNHRSMTGRTLMVENRKAYKLNGNDDNAGTSVYFH
ncbi:hypothetical protein L6452_44423 [Arctium lappa]|uniref:Uncharacterized protein n=1 Tax=Arctium lappa TaxID=4217 RepID=A0ACB8XF79_ARCLA|nr:hypothetical protein L6452_44423 [Arctium lappa]